MPRHHPNPTKVSTLFLAAMLLVAGGSAVRAQGEPTPTTSPGGSTTTSAPDTTTTTEGSGFTIPGPGGSTTTTAAAPPTTASGELPPGSPGYQDGSGDGDGGVPPGTPRTVPPDAQRIISSVVRSRPNSTYKLIEALRPLESEGHTSTEAALVGFGSFPVAGPTTFVHDWYFPRYTPSFHLHQGTDLFAPLGTPVRAPFDGTLRHSNGPVGGLASYVTAPDGTYAYLAHLSAFFPGHVDGITVRQGDVVGFVGNTGNAAGGATHVHFQLHPKGGGPADPKATLDAWLADALARAPEVIERIRAQRQSPTASGASVTDVAPAAAAAGLSPETDAPAGPEALWAVAANPSAGTLGVAADLVAGALGEVDWNGAPPPPGQAAAVLDPLFPPAFSSA